MKYGCSDNAVRIIVFFTSQVIIVKSTMFKHLTIHTYTLICPDGKIHN